MLAAQRNLNQSLPGFTSIKAFINDYKMSKTVPTPIADYIPKANKFSFLVHDKLLTIKFTFEFYFMIKNYLLQKCK